MRLQALWRADDTAPTRRSAFLAASIISGHPLHIERDIQLLDEGGIDLLHFDVMDGCFVPRLGLGPELVRAVRKVTEIPIDVHLMVADPERFIPVFVEAGADVIVIHAEATTQLPRLLALIRRCGARPGVALNPATHPSILTYVLDEVDMVLLMTVNPGSTGEQAMPASLRKIADVRALLGESANRIHIMIDGNVGPENAPEMIRAGATVLVCGSSSIYGQVTNVRDALLTFRKSLNGQ
jgi:ribulose-phosphate 3-epimerase